MSKRVELTAKQQVHTLSAKKKKAKKTFRYALAQTFPRYWPQLSEDQAHQFHSVLNASQNVNPELFANQKSNTEPKTIYWGLQSSIRNLKSSRIKLLVLSADLKPRYVINQIILLALASNQHIRILCVPNLENITQTIFNFSSCAFAVSTNFRSPELDKWTADIISEHFPVPSTIQSHFAQQKEIRSELPTKMEVDAQTERKPPSKSVENTPTSLYLYRKVVNQRAFVPDNAIDLKPLPFELEPLNKIKSDYVSLDTYDNNDEPSSFSASNRADNNRHFRKKGKNPLAMYRELTVHRLQSNPNKIKKNKHKQNKKQFNSK